MNGKIVGIEWRSGIDSVCIVAVEYGKYWQAYIGATRMKEIFVSDIQDDPMVAERSAIIAENHTSAEKRTAEHGCKLSWQEAQVFFPSLDITRYKTYPKKEQS